LSIKITKTQLGSWGNRVHGSTRISFGIVSTLVTTAISLWFLGVIGVEATVAHTLGDFIRLVSESA